jgi:hypothetical protein
VDNVEAKLVLTIKLDAFVARPYSELVTLIGKPEVLELAGESGTNFQIEFNVFFDSKPGGDLRIVGSIDDGLRAWMPLTRTLIMKPDGTLV